MQLFHAYSRPQRGTRGPQKKFERPIVTRTPALEALMISGVVPNSSAISLAAENIDVLLKLAVKAAKLVASTTSHLIIDGAL